MIDKERADRTLDEAIASLFGDEAEDTGERPLRADLHAPSDPDPWHSFDLEEQATRALGIVADLLPRTAADPYLWKWVMIATHDALHGFMCLALRRSDGAQLLIPKHEQQTYARWNRERQQGRPIVEDEGHRIDQVLNLFEKIQDERLMRQVTHSRTFVPPADQDSCVRYLDRLRNDLTHYSDVTLVVFVADLPRIVLGCLSVVDWLLHQSNNVGIYEQVTREAAERSVRQIAEQANRLAAIWTNGIADPVSADSAN